MPPTSDKAMNPRITFPIMDEIQAEDSAPCDRCGKPIAIGLRYTLHEFVDPNSGELLISQIHLKCDFKP